MYIGVSNLPFTEFDTDTLKDLRATLESAKQQENDVLARVRACETVSLIDTHPRIAQERSPSWDISKRHAW